MFMDCTKNFVFTKEDSALLEEYFAAVGQRPEKAFVVLGGRTGRGAANGVCFLFPNVGLREAVRGIHNSVFVDMFDPDDVGEVSFCPDEQSYLETEQALSASGKVYDIYKNGVWSYYG